MNELAAQMLSHLTASMRFEGSLNVDLNEVTMNLVPFPRLKFLLSSIAPLQATPRSGAGAGAASVSQAVDGLFSQLLHRDSQLIKADPKHGMYLACALMARGHVPMSDLVRNVDRIKKSVSMVPWNPDGFKIGICGTPPAGEERALLCLSNNCCITDTFDRLETRFNMLYRRRAMVHHYERFMNVGGGDAKALLDSAADNLHTLIEEYQQTQDRGGGGADQGCGLGRFIPVL
mmetsp:Transcript_86281/g.230429  ORF Transcript_86281/g.230429 Transcript_86281/m.230429 type:complete len:232 (+) Transcript_86281:808-1503(+)